MGQRDSPRRSTLRTSSTRRLSRPSGPDSEPKDAPLLNGSTPSSSVREKTSPPPRKLPETPSPSASPTNSTASLTPSAPSEMPSSRPSTTRPRDSWTPSTATDTATTSQATSQSSPKRTKRLKSHTPLQCTKNPTTPRNLSTTTRARSPTTTSLRSLTTTSQSSKSQSSSKSHPTTLSPRTATSPTNPSHLRPATTDTTLRAASLTTVTTTTMITTTMTTKKSSHTNLGQSLINQLLRSQHTTVPLQPTTTTTLTQITPMIAQTTTLKSTFTTESEAQPFSALVAVINASLVRENADHNAQKLFTTNTITPSISLGLRMLPTVLITQKTHGSPSIHHLMSDNKLSTTLHRTSLEKSREPPSHKEASHSTLVMCTTMAMLLTATRPISSAECIPGKARLDIESTECQTPARTAFTFHAPTSTE